MYNIIKKLKNHWKITLYLFLLIYICLVIMLLITLNEIPKIYETKQANQVEDYSKKITEILNENNNNSIRIQALNKLIEDIPSELIIEGNNFDYHTIEKPDFQSLNETINNDVVAFKSFYRENGYDIFVAIYSLRFQEYFYEILKIITSIITAILIVMTVIVWLLFKKLVNPISRLRNIIRKIKNYELDSIDIDFNTEYDILSKELNIFSIGLKNRFDDFIDDYSLLEKDLRVYQEKNMYKIDHILALVHELKTPINIMMLEKKMPKNSNILVYSQEIEKSCKVILKKIEELLKIINTEKYENKKENIDVIKITYEVLNLFKPFFKEKKMYYIVESEKSLFININQIEFKQIIHNIISNITNYAKVGSAFELSIELKNDVLFINSYNQVENINQIEFSKVFNLFYHSGTGTGVGLYTVKKMIESYQGNCSFEKRNDGVLLSIEIPIGIKNEEN